MARDLSEQWMYFVAVQGKQKPGLHSAGEWSPTKGSWAFMQAWAVGKCAGLLQAGNSSDSFLLPFLCHHFQEASPWGSQGGPWWSTMAKLELCWRPWRPRPSWKRAEVKNSFHQRVTMRLHLLMQRSWLVQCMPVFLLWINPSALLPPTGIQRKLCTTTHLYCSISRPCWGWDNHMPYLTSGFLLPSHCYSRVYNWKAVERGLFESWCLPLGNQDIDSLITYVHPFPKAYTASTFLRLQVSLREKYILTSNP